MTLDDAALDRLIRHEIYRCFSADGVAPVAEALASTVSVPLDRVRQSLSRLAAAHSLVLAPGTWDIWMAHPFSAVPTDFLVETSRGRYWANCAWDALGIPTLLEVDSRTETKCQDCGESITLQVQDGAAAESDAVIHFLVPPRRFWDDIGFT